MKIAQIQMHVSADKAENIRHACDLVRSAGDIDLAVLPEMFCCPYDNACFRDYGEPFAGPAQRAMSQLARERGIYLIAGSLPELEGHRVYNTSFVYAPDGTCIARHRKIHLFDIDVEGGQRFMESEVLSPGREVTTFDTPWGTMGLCICFDMRFQELCRLMALRGARVIFAPAAFNMTTGPAHWELLLRQRAGYRLLNFYLHPGAKLFLPGQTLPLVTELACREKDQAAMRRAQDALCALGFTEAFFRLRRTRAAIPVQNTAETPAEASFEAVWAFLLAQFDPLTGCIPPDEELRQAVSAGQVLCLMDADGISGLLHYAPGRAQCEIRHLAVRADCRGHGYAGRLLRLLEGKTGGQKCAVWARVGNAPAEHFYEKNQFQPDGWQSVVLRLG